MKVLHLTLKRKWFDMIASGEKIEEYREVKRYWIQRLCNEIEYESGGSWEAVCKRFDSIKFTNGYGKNAPKVTLAWDGVAIGTGNPEWGAEPGKEYFVIKLGKIIQS